MSRRLIVSIAIAGALPAGALLGVCQNPTGQNNFLCASQATVWRNLACGVTKNDNDTCYRIHTAEHGCTFALGDWGTPDYIQVWWHRKPAKPGTTKPANTDDECRILEQSIPLCTSAPEEPDPGCPDVQVSDPCDFGCGDLRLAELRSFPGWDEECRAYALMPRGWKKDPWTAAGAFFTVGRSFPSEALSWRVGDEPYGAVDALGEGRLGPTMLGAVGVTPLWGGEDGIIPRDWRELVRKVGVCVNEPGAILASPHWPDSNMRFPVPVTCDGTAASMGLKFYIEVGQSEWDQATWEASGARAADVLPRLKKLAGFDLVCVTPELALDRARERESKPSREK